MIDLFKQLDDEDEFVRIIKQQYEALPKKISSMLRCDVTFDEKQYRLAFEKYSENIVTVSSFVSSGNPDQFKRAAALFDALYKNNPITSVNFVGCDTSELQPDGFSPVGFHYADAVNSGPFIQLYDEYQNEMVSFDIAYRFCSTYVKYNREYTPDFFEIFCAFLQQNPDTSLDTLFILFKAVFQ